MVGRNWIESSDPALVIEKELQTKWSVHSFTWPVVVFAVKKRIERTQARLDKLSNQELLLEAGHALRIEKDRQKELESQLEQQMQGIQRANTVLTTTPQHLIE